MTTDFFGHPSVGEAFAARVAAHPDRVALTLHRTGGVPGTESLTFAELDRRARVRAAELGSRLAPGERVLLALPTCHEFVELYLACLLTGLIAVPVPVPGGSPHARARVEAIVRDCTPALVLTAEPDRPALAAWLRDQGTDVPVESAGPVAPDATTRIADGYRPDRATVGVLQYSSGSTDVPKGVVLTQGNILANAEAFATDCDLTPDDRFGNWIPLHHDMGLFTQLTTALVLGASSVLMPATDFVKRPVEWLRMLTSHRISVTAAPNFAYDLCLRLVTDAQLAELDLSSLRFVGNGSEPIHAPTLTAFTERFRRAGLPREAVAPGYGLAEATVFVCANPPGRRTTLLTVDRTAAEHGRISSAAHGRELVGLGTPGGFEARIVDPQSRRPVADGEVGELWLRGASVGSGYWNRPELTRSVFEAAIADLTAPHTEHERGWLRTGDLGTLLDGELFVTGRIKELLVVRGRNLFPQDLEQESRAAHEALVGFFGAAFSVLAPDERIVLVHEVSPKVPAAGLPAVAAAVRRRWPASIGVPLHNVVLVRRGSVRRTTSGKVQRSTMRELFLAGALTEVHSELEPAVRDLVQPLAVGGAA